MSDRPFELRVIARPGGDYGVALYQRPGAVQSHVEDEWERVVQVWGTAFGAVADEVLTAIKRSGYRGSDLRRDRKKPFGLEEEAGVRLGLLLLAVKPLSKMTRIEDVSQSIHTMSTEEAYYWYSKCSGNGAVRRAQRALRILLSEE